MRQKILIFIAVFFLLITTILALHLGNIPIPFERFLHLFDESRESLILLQSRIPRILSAIVVGASLALSGILYQGVINNPLVSPSILGVLNGASFGAAFAMILGLNIFGMEILSFIFGISAMGISLAISYTFDRGSSLLYLILGGIITSSFFGALLSILKILADPYNTLPSIVYYLMGSLSNVEIQALLFASAILVVASLLSLRFHKELDLLNLDDESAKSLGLNIKKYRFLFISLATLLASCSVAVGGIIGWIGLVIPHIARLLIGPKHFYTLIFSIVLGAEFLLLCDSFARTQESEIPIGILSALFGIILFIIALYFSKKDL